MLWYWVEVSKSLLDEVDVLLVVGDTTGNDQALSWSDVVHDELLEHSSVNVIDVLAHTKSWHTESVVSVSGSKKKLLVSSEWIVLGQVVEEIVRFLVL